MANLESPQARWIEEEEEWFDEVAEREGFNSEVVEQGGIMALHITCKNCGNEFYLATKKETEFACPYCGLGYIYRYEGNGQYEIYAKDEFEDEPSELYQTEEGNE